MTTFTVSSITRRFRPTTLLLTTLWLVLAGSQCYAQFLRSVDATKPPLRPMYGVANDEFYIAATFQKWGPVEAAQRGDQFFDLWNHAHYMGIPLIHLQIDHDSVEQYQRFFYSGDRQSGDRVLVTLKPLSDMGWGQAIEFYPFDSVQSSLWPTKFLHRQGGDTNGNFNNPDPQRPGVYVQEELYTTSNTGANDSILWGVVYGYDPALQQYRWVKPWMNRSFFSNDSVQKTNAFLKDRRDRPIPQDTMNYLVLTGHLKQTPNPNILGTEPLLRIDIVYEIPKYNGPIDPEDPTNPQSVTYFNASGQQLTAQQDMEFVCRSYLLRKQDLIDASLGWNEYKEVVFPMSLRWCSDELTRGPFHASTTSKSIDVRVHWLGVNEDVYLRSVSLRDYRGQMTVGRTAEARAYRSNNIMRLMKQLLYGASVNLNNRVETYPADSLRRYVIGFQCGEEQYPNEYGAFNGVAKLMADSFNLAAYKSLHGGTLQAGDSLPLFSHDLGQRSFAEVTTNPQTGSYLYINSANDTMARFLGPNGIRPDTLFETDVHQIPSIIEHNGGRGHLPLLSLTEQGIEDYNTAFQRLFVGYNHPGQSQLYTNRRRYWPGMLGRDSKEDIHIHGMAASAESARDHGRRHIPVIGTTFLIGLRDSSTSGPAQYDTIYSHVPEASELWALANLSLAYGAKGVFWWQLGSYPGVLVQNAAGHWITGTVNNSSCCSGSQGFYWQDNYQNTLNYSLYDKYADPTDSITIPNFYVGWGDRTGAIRGITRWLKIIGPELMKLKWRDAFSIHHAVRNPNLTRDTLFRPLPSNEIVTKVTSRKPGGSLDAPERTFVELGLFQTVTDGTADRTNDTNYLYVVNRRSFARPDSISATSTRGQQMDALADTRTINLQLNLQHPDTSGYNLVRVREIAIDSSAIPLSGQLRKPMDTIVGCRSIVSLTLPPGRGSLLEITFAEPGDYALFGDLRFNNQRKFLFDGKRWHAVYQRRRANDTSVDNYEADILYRRSYPVTPTTGGIKWEAYEELISGVRVAADTAIPTLICHQNRFPSITLHTQDMDTCVAIVWTAHHDPLKRERKVMFRSFHYDTTRTISGADTTQLITFNPKEVVSLYRSADGKATETWGTPVINANHAGYIIAWSDDSLGVFARGRMLAPMPTWWGPTGTYTPNTLNVSSRLPLPGIGKYPSVPSFAHVTSQDSNCAIVWQHTTAGGANMIGYTRLMIHQFPGTIGIGYAGWSGAQVISEGNTNYHPSIDQTQYYLGTVQEGVTWESVDWTPTYITPNGDTSFMNVTSINYLGMATETRRRQDTIYPWEPQHDLVEFSYPVWPLQKFPVLFPNWWYTSYQYIYGAWFAWPNIASANESATEDHQSDTARFSIVGNTMNSASRVLTTEGMQHISVPFGFGPPTALRKFIYSGAWPNASASPIRQAGRQGTLYEGYKPAPDSILQATREFMARQRPQDYIATGREVEIMVDDTARAFLAVQLADPWVATDSASWGVGMIERDTSQVFTNTIGIVQELFRSKSFTAHDTVVVGCQVRGIFRGDTAYSHGRSLRCIAELVNASNHQAVAQLDSFGVSKTDSIYYANLQDTLDVLSGSYYLRLRIESDSFPALPYWWQQMYAVPLYPVTEIASYVGDHGFGKVQRERTSSGSQARIAAQPNPFTGTTELRFSIPKAGYTTVRVFDPVGRMVAEILPQQWMEVGRYAAQFNASQLPAGTYVVELLIGQQRVVEKMVVAK